MSINVAQLLASKNRVSEHYSYQIGFQIIG